MMTWKIRLLIALVGFFHQTYGEDCVPDGVRTLQIAPNATLYWGLNPSENCNVSVYQVDITNDKGKEYHHNVTDTFLDVSFLEVCSIWTFTVIPISSQKVVGRDRVLTDYIPVPPDADLTIGNLAITLQEGRDILFDWRLADNTHKNCNLWYILNVQDQELGTNQDVYLEDSPSNISFLSPCVSYKFNIKAVNRAIPNIEGPVFTYKDELAIPPKPQVPPALASVEAAATSIDLTLTLEKETNRCPLSNIYVDGGRYFNFSIPLTDSVDLEAVPVQLKSLSPNSLYTFNVIIENSAGLSPAAIISVQTLEQ